MKIKCWWFSTAWTQVLLERACSPQSKTASSGPGRACNLGGLLDPECHFLVLRGVLLRQQVNSFIFLFLVTRPLILTFTPGRIWRLFRIYHPQIRHSGTRMILRWRQLFSWKQTLNSCYNAPNSHVPGRGCQPSTGGSIIPRRLYTLRPSGEPLSPSGFPLYIYLP